MDCLILCGNSGAGKDTITKHLQALFPDTIVNVKFGELPKLLVAKAFDTTLESMEDKSYRSKSQAEWFNLSPMDILGALYRGASVNTTYANCEYVRHKLECYPDRLPIFTDIRRRLELDFLIDHLGFINPWFVNVLQPGDGSLGENDDDIETIVTYARNSGLFYCSFLELQRQPEHTVVDTVEILLQKTSLEETLLSYKAKRSS